MFLLNVGRFSQKGLGWRAEGCRQGLLLHVSVLCAGAGAAGGVCIATDTARGLVSPHRAVLLCPQCHSPL